MIKPEGLKKGDKVAIVSLSSGLLGEPDFIHKYHLGKKRLEEEFSLEVIAMPNALKGLKFIEDHPELRAQDLMDAFKDKTIKGIISNNDVKYIGNYFHFINRKTNNLEGKCI